VNDNEARNMGSEHHMAHDERYDQADEFMEVVLGHWDSWDDDAVLVDRKNGVFADPTKVRRLDHDGEHYRSRGPFTVPRSPQGHPVVIQAGSSPRGLAFGARWGELIFAAYGTIENAKVEYAAMKEAATSYGRDPDQMKIASLTFPVVAATRSEAVEKKAAYDELPNEIDQLPLLSEALNFDFASKGMDEAFSDEDLEGLQGMQALRDGVVRRSGIKNPTVRDFIRVSGRGRLGDGWVGSATEIADQLEAWFTEPACDGFVVGPTHIPGAFEDFVDLVVPELQRRGLYREEYTGTTLRDHLGLRMPSLRG
jgi:FMN-dependent oxidoreductase (nitrilotriacetate monooxygenase family)